MDETSRLIEQSEKESALLAASKAMIDMHRPLGFSRSEMKALMVHPDEEENSPGAIFDMLWPEGS